MTATDPYPKHRPNVGIAVFNAEGQIWVGRRNQTEPPWNWQMPQGGIDKGEDPLDAAYRELFEETGIRREDVSYLGTIENWLAYDYPPEVRDDPRFARKKHLGQKQRWFAFRFSGDESRINLNAHGEVEFDAWRWEDLAEVPGLIIPWKRDVYTRVAEAFSPYTR